MVTLVTSPDCHLCGHGRQILDVLAAEGLVGWREVSTSTPAGRELEARLPPLRPVLLDERGDVVAYGRLSERRLRRTLSAARTGA